MKKIIFALLILGAIVSAGCKKSAKEKIIGSWKLTNVEGQKLTADDLKSTMVLTKEGKFTLTTGDQHKREGTWVISDDGKTLTAKSGEKDSETWNIKKLDEKKFVFTVGTDSTKISMEKMQ